MDTINKYCGPYDKDCGTTDNTKMIKLMGKLSNELDNDNVHPGVNNLMNGITINSALHAVYDKNEESDDDEFKIFSGGDKKLFTRRGTSYEIDMPIKGRTEVKDFNGDGKADLLFIHGKKYDNDDKKYIGKEKLVLWLSAD